MLPFFKEILNLKGHQNCITGSKVTAILLNAWILPIGGASAVKGPRLQPAQQACLFLNINRNPILHRSDFQFQREQIQGSKSHYWFKSYGNFAEWVDFAYWWSFSGEGYASAACAAGFFLDISFLKE